jgi:NADH:ubiquinone oxidoreductase subunit 5 (subunit L)/multisubunit Na+/H+ antiporter MnhA subunit
MHHSLAYLFPATVPLAYLALAMRARTAPGRWSTWLAAVPLGLALFNLAVLLMHGPGGSPLVGIVGFGASFRLDGLSVSLLALVSCLGLAILHFSRQYLAGDPHHGTFLRDLALTLAAVTTLVSAGNLYLMIGAWIAMSLLLNRLLLFRHERAGARLAAKKKFILARVGDASLLVSFGVMIAALGTADIGELMVAVRQANGEQQTALGISAGLVALTAVLKSAQFPCHGWLVEVMETPTPVSALLHAGVVNAGGFLLLRFADLLSAFPAVSVAVAGIGALTAIVGTAIMLTQSNIKGSLAYSTVAQMGFMVLQCGLGAYTSATVHLLGHSLYKAYAFLDSGSTVRHVARAGWRSGARASGWLEGLLNLVLIIATYGLVAQALDYGWQREQVVTWLGLILALGMWLHIDTPRPGLRLRLHLLAGTAGVAAAYLLTQKAAASLYGAYFPATPPLSDAASLILAVVLAASVILVLLQGRRLTGPAWQRLRVHLSRGLYINTLTNRWLGAFRTRQLSDH